MATLKYLDDTGVALLWAKIKAAIAAKPDSNTTYTIQQSMVDAHQFSLIGSDSSTVTITIPDNGEENVIETIQVDGVSITPTSKTVNITGLAPLASPALTGTPTAPTAAVGTDTTQIATTAFVKAAIAAASIGIQFEIVQSLPASGNASTIYLLSHGGTAPDVYDEYIWINNAWEKIGTTQVDLSNYVQFSDLVAITSSEIDQICT
jgi:hypothetical protein